MAQPRVAVTGQIVAAGVGDRGHARGDRDGGKVRGRGETRSQVGGCPGDVPVPGFPRLIGDQRCVVTPGSEDRRSAVRRGHAGAGRVDNLLPRGRRARQDRRYRSSHTGELPEVKVFPERRKGGPGGSWMIGVVRGPPKVTRVPGAQEGAGCLLRVLASRGARRQVTSSLGGPACRQHQHRADACRCCCRRGDQHIRQLSPLPAPPPVPAARWPLLDDRREPGGRGLGAVQRIPPGAVIRSAAHLSDRTYCLD